MSDHPYSLSTEQMATFAARGFLRLDAVVPDEINRQFLDDIGKVSPEADSIMGHYGRIMQGSVIPLVDPGTPLASAYPAGSALRRLVDLPQVDGAITSLVGTESVVDHHFLHITFPEAYHHKPPKSQFTHQDSTIDPRQAFDIQLFYFPHEVTPEMGGTRFIPGTQYRIVSEAAVARYQNVLGQEHAVCPAGTVMIFHMGLWHGGGLNRSEALRYMFKIRLCPTRRQIWQGKDYHADQPARPIFWTGANPEPHALYDILMKPEPWFEADTSRLEFLNRVRFWRYITADDNFDADYWLTRVENEYH